MQNPIQNLFRMFNLPKDYMPLGEFSPLQTRTPKMKPSMQSPFQLPQPQAARMPFPMFPSPQQMNPMMMIMMMRLKMGGMPQNKPMNRGPF